MTPTQLATELSITPKQLRDWLRATYPRPPKERGQRYGDLSRDVVAAAVLRFREAGAQT